MSAGRPGRDLTNEGEIMKSDHNTLALRRHSIRVLSPSELRVARGGETGNGTGGGNGGGNGTGTGTHPTR
jgi:hypothetical protein